MSAKSIRIVEEVLVAVLLRIAPKAANVEFVADEFFARFAAIGWRLRHLACILSNDETASLKLLGLAAPEMLSVADLARIHLLRRVLERLPGAAHAAFVEELFRKGDNKECEAVLRGLVLLPAPEQFIATAVGSCRAAVQTTFEAIACENTYPEKYFSSEVFRAMVLKALHLGIPVRRIHGLERCRDDDLRRMATDYASELEAAGKPIPADIAIIQQGGATA
jgi:hypothetical protein